MITSWQPVADDVCAEEYEIIKLQPSFADLLTFSAIAVAFFGKISVCHSMSPEMKGQVGELR